MLWKISTNALFGTNIFNIPTYSITALLVDTANLDRIRDANERGMRRTRATPYKRTLHSNAFHMVDLKMLLRLHLIAVNSFYEFPYSVEILSLRVKYRKNDVFDTISRSDVIVKFPFETFKVS